MQDPEHDNSPNSTPSQETRKQWAKELAELKRQHIGKRGWSEREARRKIIDCWVAPGDGRVDISHSKKPPEGAWPAFQEREPHGLKVPPEVSKRLLELFGFISKSYYLPFPELCEGMMNSLNMPIADERPALAKRRHKALAWCRKYRELYPQFAELAKDKLPELHGLLMSVLQMKDAFDVMQSYLDKRHCKKIDHADSFVGKEPDPVNARLKEVLLKHGHLKKKPEFYFKLAGGTRTQHGYWDFKGIPGRHYDHGPLCDRMDKLRRDYPPG